ncbi:YcxB family protein [Streptomyces sp. NPDC050617]|uniref:YcxB family protein n=1 Tax=Streptomyces sp. NPDC050617 TaxID=3154628 RepID=UPI00342A2E03
MSAEPQTQARVELSYEATIEDFREGLAARGRASAAARRTRLLLIACAVLMLAGAIRTWVAEKSVDLPLVVTPAVVLFALLGGPRLQARRFHQLAAANGACRTVVDETGVAVANERQTSAQNWQAMPRYTETPRLFVLFSADKHASCLSILPKRGARDEADVDRLRALFDRHMTRV